MIIENFQYQKVNLYNYHLSLLWNRTQNTSLKPRSRTRHLFIAEWPNCVCLQMVRVVRLSQHKLALGLRPTILRVVWGHKYIDRSFIRYIVLHGNLVFVVIWLTGKEFRFRYSVPVFCLFRFRLALFVFINCSYWGV